MRVRRGTSGRRGLAIASSASSELRPGELAEAGVATGGVGEHQTGGEICEGCPEPIVTGAPQAIREWLEPGMPVGGLSQRRKGSKGRGGYLFRNPIHAMILAGNESWRIVTGRYEPGRLPPNP